MTASAPLRMFLPITKVDATQRLVYGLATGETVDRSGEICDYASTKPYYEKWSGDIAKATDGKSLGNLRAMHGNVAAGKVTAIAFNDDAKQIEIAAKVVDDAEWTKVVEGVYTGFSQGGGYVKRWKDDNGLQRYTADPSEVSLVDLPCLESATFQMIKSADAVETRHFAESVQVKAEPTNTQVAEKAGELAKAAGRETDWTAFLDEARAQLRKAALPAPEPLPISDRHIDGKTEVTPPAPGEGVEQVWKAKDGSTHVRKVDALAKNAEIDAAALIAPSTKAVTDELDSLAGKLGIEKSDSAPGHGTKKPGEGKDQATAGGASAMNANSKKKPRIAPDGSPMKGTSPSDLLKSLYTASAFAEMLANLRGMAASATYDSVFSGEGADADFAAKMKAWVAVGCALLVAIIQDEVDGLSDAGDALVLEMAAGVKPGSLSALEKVWSEVGKGTKLEPVLKAGARNSKADQEKIQAMHDHACDLGAACDADNCPGADKSAGGDLAKALDAMTINRNAEKARGDALQKTIDDQIVPMLKAIGDKVEKIEKQPIPLPFGGHLLRVANKGGDGIDTEAVQAEIERMQKEDPESLRLLLHKIAQQQPRQMHAG